MLRRVQHLSCLIAVLLGAFTSNLLAKEKKPSESKPSTLAIDVKATATSQNPGVSAKDQNDKEHCFGLDTPDDPRDLTFEVKTTGISKGTITVQIENLSKMRDAMKNGMQSVDKDQLQDYAEAMQVALKKDRANAHRTRGGIATLTFRADANGSKNRADHKGPIADIHLGPGTCDPGSTLCSALYTANISIVRTTTGSKRGQEMTQFTYYYRTYVKDPSECSKPW